MAYLPPVNLPDLSGKNYAKELYGMISGVGEAYYGAKRDKIGDQQWQSEQDRMTAAQALAQSNADRDYALRLRQFDADQAAATAGPTEVYGTKVPVMRADGSFGYDLIRKDGSRQPFEPGEGERFLPDVTWRDTGTGYTPTDKYGQPVPGIDPIQKNIADENRQKTIGTGGGQAAIALPGIQHNVSRAVQGVDDLLSDPELLNVIGPIEGRLPSVSWDGSRERAQSRVDYVVGQVFQQAYDAIRGAGPISQYETQAARDAYARVQNQTMGDADYKEALQDFKNELLALGALAERKAAAEASGQGGQPQQAPGQPIYVDPDGTEVYEAQ